MARAFFLTLVAFTLVVTSAHADWRAGETLYYKISWGWITAGAAELRYEALDADQYRITGRAWTTAGPATLKEKLQSTGLVVTDGLVPQFYKQQQIENKYRAHKTLDFFEAGRVAYDSLLDEAPAYVYEIPAGAQDMLTAMYHLRMHGMDMNQTFGMDIVTLGDVKPMTVTISEPKLLRVRTLREEKFVVREVRPVVANSKQRWVIYVTDDEYRRPIQIELRSKFGTFKARLAEIDGVSKVPAGIPLEEDLF